jgi:DNA-binding MarR family transcriptional regulator
MSKVSSIGGLLKKLYRSYSNSLLQVLELKGFTDLRPSFLEVLLVICENPGSSIRDIGKNCELKKQTMTSHLNELEKRGYIKRQINPHDKREQNIFLTDYGDRFKLALFEGIESIERNYARAFGDVELERMEAILLRFHGRINSQQTAKTNSNQALFDISFN